jgi:hypothetical protein
MKSDMIRWQHDNSRYQYDDVSRRAALNANTRTLLHYVERSERHLHSTASTKGIALSLIFKWRTSEFGLPPSAFSPLVASLFFLPHKTCLNFKFFLSRFFHLHCIVRVGRCVTSKQSAGAEMYFWISYFRVWCFVTWDSNCGSEIPILLLPTSMEDLVHCQRRLY